MTHLTPRGRHIWVALLALALLSACAPQRPQPPTDALKTGQAVSQAAAKSTHEADIDALVLSSSSMDRDAAVQDEADAPQVLAPDAGLSADEPDASDDSSDDASDDAHRTDATPGDPP